MRLSRRVLVTVVVTVVVGATVPAHAQSATATLQEPPRHRQGYYLAGGIAALATQISDEGKSLGVWGGSGYTLRMGQLLTRRFGLGLQIDFGGTAKGSQRAGLFGISMAAQWELLRNFALHGGTGLGVVSLTDVDDPEAELDGGYGAAFFAGVSYDWFLSKRRISGGWAITPFFQVRYLPTDTFDAAAGLLGVQVNYWTGLPDNQLLLPESEAYKRR